MVTVSPKRYQLDATPGVFFTIEELAVYLKISKFSLTRHLPSAPPLRRESRIRSVQASFDIEGNTLNLEQVTAVLEGQNGTWNWPSFVLKKQYNIVKNRKIS